MLLLNSKKCSITNEKAGEVISADHPLLNKIDQLLELSSGTLLLVSALGTCCQ